MNGFREIDRENNIVDPYEANGQVRGMVFVPAENKEELDVFKKDLLYTFGPKAMYNASNGQIVFQDDFSRPTTIPTNYYEYSKSSNRYINIHSPKEYYEGKGLEQLASQYYPVENTFIDKYQKQATTEKLTKVMSIYQQQNSQVRNKNVDPCLYSPQFQQEMMQNGQNLNDCALSTETVSQSLPLNNSIPKIRMVKKYLPTLGMDS